MVLQSNRLKVSRASGWSVNMYWNILTLKDLLPPEFKKVLKQCILYETYYMTTYNISLYIHFKRQCVMLGVEDPEKC